MRREHAIARCRTRQILAWLEVPHADARTGQIGQAQAQERQGLRVIGGVHDARDQVRRLGRDSPAVKAQVEGNLIVA